MIAHQHRNISSRFTNMFIMKPKCLVKTVLGEGGGWTIKLLFDSASSNIEFIVLQKNIELSLRPCPIFVCSAELISIIFDLKE